MTQRGRPKQANAGNSVSSRVRLTPVRKEQIDAVLFAKALIAAQFHAAAPDASGTEADTTALGNSGKKAQP